MRITGPTLFLEPNDQMDPTVAGSMTTLLIGGARGVMLSFSEHESLVRLIATLIAMDREWTEAKEFAAEPVEMVRD